MVASIAIRRGHEARNSGMATSPASPALKKASRTPEHELALLERVCAGDKHLFYELIQPYERSVYIAAHSVLQNEADAEEVAQEAFLKAFSHLTSFRKETKFSTWLIQIAVNEARMKRRKDRKGLYESIDQQHSPVSLAVAGAEDFGHNAIRGIGFRIETGTLYPVPAVFFQPVLNSRKKTGLAWLLHTMAAALLHQSAHCRRAVGQSVWVFG